MASPAILTAIYVARDEAPHAFDQLKKLTTPTITPDEALAWWESQTVDGTFFKTYVEGLKEKSSQRLIKALYDSQALRETPEELAKCIQPPQMSPRRRPRPSPRRPSTPPCKWPRYPPGRLTRRSCKRWNGTPNWTGGRACFAFPWTGRFSRSRRPPGRRFMSGADASCTRTGRSMKTGLPSPWGGKSRPSALPAWERNPERSTIGMGPLQRRLMVTTSSLVPGIQTIGSGCSPWSTPGPRGPGLCKGGPRVDPLSSGPGRQAHG
jgi:hypothetical protein